MTLANLVVGCKTVNGLTNDSGQLSGEGKTVN